jgi:PLP dependent protein
MRHSTIADRLEHVRLLIASACLRSGRRPEEITLIAVTKGFLPNEIRQAAAAGARHFGENRVQEAEKKRPELEDLPPDVTWHMIGHLQTNKVKTALNLFAIIHSVDSLRLAETISRRASAPVPVFLEVNVAGDATKYGFTLEELPRQYEKIAQLPNLDVRGLMTVAPMVTDPQQTRPVFRRLRQEAESLGLKELSMGMTDDFEVAVEEGATHVRIGRAIFGERQA